MGLAVPALVASGCAPKSPRAAHPLPPPPAVRPGTSPLPVPSPELRDGYAIARTALALRGIPYRLGGSDTRGFDCSGLVQYVFALHGLGLPRVVRDQYRSGIWYASDAQKRTAEEFIGKLGASGRHTRPIVTQVEAAATFYPAEDYHQDYVVKSGRACHVKNPW